MDGVLFLNQIYCFGVYFSKLKFLEFCFQFQKFKNADFAYSYVKN